MPPSHDPDRGEILRRVLSWAIVVAAVAATAVVFVAVDSRSHSASDTFYGMAVPEILIVGGAAGAWLTVRAWGARAR